MERTETTLDIERARQRLLQRIQVVARVVGSLGISAKEAAQNFEDFGYYLKKYLKKHQTEKLPS